MKCFFCEVQNYKNGGNIFGSTDNFCVRLSGFPVSNGHCEIFSKKHTKSIFDLKKEEIGELFELIQKTKTYLDEEYRPDSYNIGINEGEEAGQTIPHLHIHIIPRYKGDVANPRGGVRWVIPAKANYSETESEKVFNIKKHLA